MPRLSTLLLAAPILLFARALAPRGAEAGTAIRLDVSGLVERAELVIEGRVIAARAVLGPASRIDTEFTIAVEHTYCGDPLATRVIRWPGGVLADGRGMIVPGMPHLAVGHSAILFLTSADPSGMRMPVGLAQGELAIRVSPDGAKMLARDQSDLALIDPRTGESARADSKSFLDYADTVACIEAGVAAKRARQNARDESRAIGGKERR
jgi:hypothetical protein